MMNLHYMAGQRSLVMPSHNPLNWVIDGIKRILNGGADTNQQDHKGEALHCVTLKKRWGSVQLLLDRGSEVNFTTTQGLPVVHMAVEYKINELFVDVLRSGPDINSRDNKGRTALHGAVRKGCKYLVRLMLDSGADINCKDNVGKTPLHIAAEKRNLEISVLLLKSGAIPSSEDIKGRTPLHIAAAISPHQIAAMLVSSGAIVNSQDYKGKTPLHIAVENRKPKVVLTLLRSGAFLNCENVKRCTPLHIAAAYRDPHVGAMLLEAGADVTVVDINGQTPLHIACDFGNAQISLLLLHSGAEANCTDVDGRTPLHFAAQTDNDTVKTLLLAGADVDTLDKNKQTPLHFAVENCWRYTASIEELLQAGASPDVKDVDGRTPVHYSSSDKAAECLLLKGARLDEGDNFGITPFDKFLENEDMTKLMIKLSVVNFQGVNDVNLNDDNVKKALGDRLLKLNSFKYECISEVKKMKNYKIGTWSLFDIFVDCDSPDPRLVSRANEIENVLDHAKKQNEYPIYVSLLRHKLKEGVKRKALLDEAVDTLHSLNTTLAIPEMRRKILAELKERDLINVIKAFQY